MLRLLPFALAIALAGAPGVGFAENGQVSVAPMRSATKARDIGGFELGMSIRDAAKLAPLERISDDNYQATKDGIEYDFGVTRLGHIYRVASIQNLGKFVLDDVFRRSLLTKLSAKYGWPQTTSVETFKWSLIESVKRTGEQALPFETNWASAYLDDGEDGVTLHVKLLDFRVRWKDDAQLNQASCWGGSAMRFVQWAVYKTAIFGAAGIIVIVPLMMPSYAAAPLRGARGLTTWTSYMNARFGVTAEYPAHLFLRPSYSTNEDGISLRSPNGAILRIFGQWNAGNQSPAAYLKTLEKYDAKYGRISYRVVKPDLVILSGEDHGIIFYERYRFIASSGAIHALTFEYPAQARSIYDPIVPRLSASLR